MATLAKYNNDASISGNAGANEIAGRVRIGKNVFMADGTYVAANTVEIGNASSVFRVYANSVKTGFDAVIRDGTVPVTLPLATPYCEIPNPFTCGGPDLIIGPGEQVGPLAPGTYGRVIIRNGATLTIQPGIFTFCGVKMGREAVFLAQGAAAVQIVGDLRVGTASTYGPAFGFPPIGTVVLGRKVRTSQSAVVTATIIAPNAKMTFGRDAAFNGCFCASQAKSDKHITLTCIE